MRRRGSGLGDGDLDELVCGDVTECVRPGIVGVSQWSVRHCTPAPSRAGERESDVFARDALQIAREGVVYEINCILDWRISYGLRVIGCVRLTSKEYGVSV